MPDQFGIRDGYEALTTAATIESSFGDYWDEGRVGMSGIYQWHIYHAASEVAKEHRLTTLGDFGCGVGTKLTEFFGEMAAAGGVHGFDQPTVAAYLAEHHPAIKFRPLDLEKPAGTLADDERFDLTICADVIEHLLDPDPAMDLLWKHTGRFCVLSTPERDYTRGFDAMKATKLEHVREWNQAEFRDYVESRGFKIVRHDLVPKEKLSEAQEAERAASAERTRLYHGCQLVVCTPA
ncbi:MAG: methyltransferase domain-containing protein [Planctomycetota bacterium]